MAQITFENKVKINDSSLPAVNKVRDADMNEIKETVNTNTPTGIVSIFAGTTAPDGWLICDGSAVSRTTYSNLFDVIGTSYGNGDGSTTFNLPNLKGRIPVGLDSNDNSFDTVGETGGEKTHTLTINEMPSHSHGFEGVNTGTTVTGETGNYPAKINQDTKPNWPGNASYSVGGGEAHNNLQPYIVMNYIISY